MQLHSLTGWIAAEVRTHGIYKLRTYRKFHSSVTNAKGQWKPYKVDLDLTYVEKLPWYAHYRQKMLLKPVRDPREYIGFILHLIWFSLALNAMFTLDVCVSVFVNVTVKFNIV